MKRSAQLLAAASLLLGLATFTFERSARAEPTAADKVAAETLFVNARKFMESGKYIDACKALAESQRLDPGVGTLLNLGRCYEKLGRTASAWSIYRDAAAAARDAHQPAREKHARSAADALEKTLPMLIVVVSGAEAAPDLEVRRDGAVVPRTLWGMSVAIDPGEHTFEASAPHSKTWRTRVTADPGKALTVKVPPLESDGTARASASNNVRAIAPAPVARKEQPAELAQPNGSGLGAQRIAALATGAAGLVATGAGGYYAYRAKSGYDRAAPCNDQNQCEDPGYSERVLALRRANMATFLVSGGLVAIAGSVVLWVTAPTKRSDDAAVISPPKPRVWVSADPFGEGGARSVVVSGAF